jgi:hypothetical protein
MERFERCGMRRKKLGKRVPLRRRLEAEVGFGPWTPWERGKEGSKDS